MNIVVLGGGTAGYISALAFKKRYPNYNIKIVDSSKIGIIGVGESTTPQFETMIKYLDLPMNEFISETGATIKNGIKFTNWTNNKPHYFHPFYQYVDMDYVTYLDNVMKQKNKDSLDYTYRDFKLNANKDFVPVIINALLLDGNLDKVNLQTELSYENKVLDSAYAWHIDAALVINFFRKHAKIRGIDVIDDVLLNAESDNSGNITKLILEKQILNLDFVIDCSGFSRLLIGKHFDSELTYVSDSLPCDSGIAFQMDGDPVPYTEAIAMNYGWAWKIPLQHRYGCGYIYDSKYINDEDALDEIKNKFGNNIRVMKNYKFKAGYYKKPWVNNCLAVGVAASFFEPLEATSLLNSTTMIEIFLKEYFDEYIKDKKSVDLNKYNNLIEHRNEHLKAFLYLHYTTNKINTPFWKDFNHLNKIPEILISFMDDMKNQFYSNSLIEKRGSIFGWSNWASVYFGNELYDSSLLSDQLDKDGVTRYNIIRERINKSKNLGIPIKEYINTLTKKGE